MKNTAIFLIIFGALAALASGGEHGGAHDEGIPFNMIGRQVANLGILLVAMFFFLRKSIVESFAKREQDFLQQSEKTKAALKGAEESLAEIKDKLANLEAGEKQALQVARQEADIQKAHMIRDAEEMAIKIKKDAELGIKNELSKAITEINTAILNSALHAAKKNLTESANDHKAALEAGFIKQLGQVKP